MTNRTTTATGAFGMNRGRACWNESAARLGAILNDSALALVARFGIAAVFWQSGRTKVDGLLTITDSTFALFADEYQVPLLAPELAATLATWAEHLFPVLLVLGLFTRLSALALLAMTAVIQIFVYPDAWPTHLTWAAPLLWLAARGAGRISIDRAIGLH